MKFKQCFRDGVEGRALRISLEKIFFDYDDITDDTGSAPVGCDRIIRINGREYYAESFVYEDGTFSVRILDSLGQECLNYRIEEVWKYHDIVKITFL